MKLYLSVDMEGVCGVVALEQVDETHREYPRAQGWLVEEVNAAVESAFAHGASEVVVNDAHGGDLYLDGAKAYAREGA